jgi:type III secretion system HrpE/YscL family protein
MRVLKAPAGVRVVPREVVDARAEAQALLRAARAEAEALVASARREAEALREEAWREGEARAHAEVSARLAAEAVKRAETARGEAETVGQLAIEVARAVLGREAAAGPEVLRDVVGRALARVRRARRIVLRVHPDDVAMARATCRQWLPAGLEPDVLDVEADAGVDRGGVVVESELGRLDARLDTQLAAIARAFAGQ